MVAFAAQVPLAVKMVLCALGSRACPADRSAAMAVVDAFAAGRLTRWEAASLLNASPHPIALPTALALLSRDRESADLCAAQAIGRMRDHQCVPTLRSLLSPGAPRDATRGAALALAHLCGADAVASLRDAYRQRTLWARTAGSALALAAVDDDTLTAWLDGDALDVSLALEVLHNLVRTPRVVPCPRPPPAHRLATRVRAALADAPHELLASEREFIEAWLAPHDPSRGAP